MDEPCLGMPGWSSGQSFHHFLRSVWRGSQQKEFGKSNPVHCIIGQQCCNILLLHDCNFVQVSVKRNYLEMEKEQKGMISGVPPGFDNGDFLLLVVTIVHKTILIFPTIITTPRLSSVNVSV